MTGLGNLVRRLARPPEVLRAEGLRRWAEGIDGVTPIAQAQPRERCKVAGVIQNLRIDPRPGRNFIEATIIDGSDKELIVRLTGRTTLAGWRLGAGLIVEGTVAERDGTLMMLNPEWDLVPGPEHG